MLYEMKDFGKDRALAKADLVGFGITEAVALNEIRNHLESIIDPDSPDYDESMDYVLPISYIEGLYFKNRNDYKVCIRDASLSDLSWFQTTYLNN